MITDQLEQQLAATATTPSAPVFQLRNVAVDYSGVSSVQSVNLDIPERAVTAIIGPSGCGKSTLLRCMNRMNDLIRGAHVTGDVLYHGNDLYAPDIDPVLVRRSIGMVFQKPNPFPKSIFDNVAFGLRIVGKADNLDDRVRDALEQASLWDEVHADLGKSALALSGGQQQRLCIARAIAAKPDTLLMDEPCSALDPISTAHIEELMQQLRERFTIVIVTHNMQQAIRVSDHTAFFTTHVDEQSDARYGKLVEAGPTGELFANPKDSRTADYIMGRFG